MKMKFLKRLCLMSIVAIALGGCGSDSNEGTDSNTTTINAANLFKEEWRDLTFDADAGIIGVPTISNGKATVNFKVTSNGRPVVGVPLGNLSFGIAKLEPGTNGGGSQWINYNVYDAASNKGKYPSVERAGIFKDNNDGTYIYTFALDISAVKGLVDAAVPPVAGDYNMKDLGDLTYNPNRTHRVVVAITSKKSVDTWDYPLLATYERVIDFVPATGKVAADESKREIISRDLCLKCHSGSARFTAHHGTRQNPQFCVICHTEQIKVGHHEAPRATNDNTTLMPEPILDANGVQETNEAGGPAVLGTHVVNGSAVASFTAFMHRIHMGKKLTLKGYDYNDMGALVPSMSFGDNASNPRCANCHAAATAATPQGDNWKKIPSRAACGSCHDGVDFVNAGTTTHQGALGDGGQQTSDNLCASCHAAPGYATAPSLHGDL